MQRIHEHEHHAHSYVWGGDTVHGLREAICACGHGLQVHTDIHGLDAKGSIINVSPS